MFRMGQGACLSCFCLWRQPMNPKRTFADQRWYIVIISSISNATINRTTRMTEPEFGTEGFTQTQQSPWVEVHVSGFGPPRHLRWGFFTVLEPNRTVVVVRTWIVGGLPGSVANSSLEICTWRPWCRTLGGGNGVKLEIHLGAVMVRDWISTWRWSIDGVPGAKTQFISYITVNCGKVTRWLNPWALMESWLMTVRHVGRHSVIWRYIQGSTRNHENEWKGKIFGCMLYSVDTILSVSTHDHGMQR